MATPQEKLNKQLVKAAGRGDIAAMALHLREGAEINGYGGAWQLYATALGNAAWNGHTRAITYLLEQGAEIDHVDKGGATALTHAIRMDRLDCVQELLRRGARTDMKDDKGRTALDLAVREEHPEIGELIMRHEEALAREKEKKIMAEAKAETALPPPKPKLDPAVVIFRSKAGNRVLEEIFNFEALERVTLVRANENAPVETMLRENFADMTNTTLLKKALAEHMVRGGKLTEQDVFITDKPKLTPRGGKL